MPTLLKPDSELVTQAWLATLPGFSSAMVASLLPTDTSTWATTGFLTTTVAGGTPGMYLPVRGPLVQVDCWAVKPGAQRPPWNHASQLAQAVVAGCYAANPVTLTVKSGYGTARVMSVWPTMEPRRLYSDESSYARMQLDLRLDWTAT